jgi:hypothetical protein
MRRKYHLFVMDCLSISQYWTLVDMANLLQVGFSHLEVKPLLAYAWNGIMHDTIPRAAAAEHDVQLNTTSAEHDVLHAFEDLVVFGEFIGTDQFFSDLLSHKHNGSTTTPTPSPARSTMALMGRPTGAETSCDRNV